MKKKSYILKIENPCSQDWTLMTANEAGRFCSHCSKTVVDFTHLSDQQIIEFLQKSATIPCMRLTNLQQNRILIPAKERHNTPTFYKFLSGLLLFGTAQNSLAINKTVPTEIVENIDNSEIENRTQLTNGLKNVIQGKIIDEKTRVGIPFVKIVIKNSNVTTITNDNGEFELVIPDNLLTNIITIVVSCEGYQVLETKISKTELPIKKDFILKSAKNVQNIKLDEVEVVTEEVPFYGEVVSGGVPMIIETSYYDNIQPPTEVEQVNTIKKKKWWQFWKKKN